MDRAPLTLEGLRIAQLLESDGPGGAETVLVHLARNLRRQGAHVCVYLPSLGQGWTRRQLEGDGVEFVEYHLDRPISPAFVSWLRRSLRDHLINIAHSHEFTFACYGSWASRLAGVGHVITMHGGRYYNDQMRRRLALRSGIALSQHTVAVSLPLKQHMCRDLGLRPSRVEVIPNGIPAPSEIDPGIRRSLGLPSDTRLLVAVGNLYPVKGHRYLIGALGALVPRHPRVHLAIAGRGDLLPELEALAARLGVSDRVHFLGLREDVPALLAAADIFVMPSLSEGLPIALLEAMFASKPIVASDVGGIKAALDDGRAGIVVPAGDENELAHEIGRLLEDPAAAGVLGRRAAAHAQREFEVSVMVSRYLALYHDALKRRAR